MQRRICRLAIFLVAACLTSNAAAGNLPEGPRSYVVTALADTPSLGNRIDVLAGGDLQDALDRAQPGDTISIEAGATFTGNFILPRKNGDSWITLQSSKLSELPGEAGRVSPANAPAMPRIRTPNTDPAIQTADGAHHYRLIGLDVGMAPGVTYVYSLVSFGNPDTRDQNQSASHLILDRSYVHGEPTTQLRRCLALNSASSAVINSYLSDAHERGQDSQAILGWNGPGPFKIVNNFLEGAGENVMFGGADALIDQLIPSDIEIRNNYFTKPWSWWTEHSTYAGRHWAVKNLLEFKNAQRVIVEGNLFENNWADAQNGFAILLTPRNQDGDNPWAAVRDIAIVSNILRHSASAFNISGSDNNYPSQQTKRALLRNNLLVDVHTRYGGSSSGVLFQIVGGPNDVTIDHNTAFSDYVTVSADEGQSPSFVYTNNLTTHGIYGIFGSGAGFGNGAFERYFPGAVFSRNALIGGVADDYSRFPDNFFPASEAAVQFTDAGGGNHRLSDGSPYQSAGVDGKDLGVDFVQLDAALNGVFSPIAPPGDYAEPRISNLRLSSTLARSAVISWTTDEACSVDLLYRRANTKSWKHARRSTLESVHAITLGGLKRNTKYSFEVRCQDAVGNVGKSSPKSFRTRRR